MNVFESLTCGGKKLDLVLEADRRRVKYDDKEYKNMSTLLKENPKLKTEHLSLAKAIDFLFQGTQDKIIEDEKDFKKFYDELIAKEASQKPSPDVPRSSSYGVFDVKEISSPKWEGEKFIFYVWHYPLQIPYRVVFTPNQKSECHYQTLNRVN